jgi:Protein of unknown function (DUF2490)
LKPKSFFIRLNILFASLSIGAISTVQGQTNQVWMDYVLNVPFANSYVFDTDVSYRTIVGNPNSWRTLSISPDIQRTITQRVDVMFAARTFFTQQETGYKTIELRPSLGMRYHFTQHNRVMLRCLITFEQRNLYYQEGSSWEHSNRIRLRPESIIAINHKSNFENHLWYGIADIEFFFVTDHQLDERFANQVRIRAGLGYRLSYDWRFEFIYADQFARNNLDKDLEETSNIFRFRIKHFLNKAKPKNVDPNNN